MQEAQALIFMQFARCEQVCARFELKNITMQLRVHSLLLLAACFEGPSAKLGPGPNHLLHDVIMTN